MFKKIEDVVIPNGVSETFKVIEDGTKDKIILLCSKMIKLLKSDKSISY